MANQKRWFKVWTSLLVDMDHLTAEQVGHWVRLGCRIALVGNNGSVKFEAGWTHVNRFFGVDNAEIMLRTLPGIECQNRHDEITVTMNNWYKYQVDSTAAERQQTSRSKKRREEIRGDEIRREENKIPAQLPKAAWPADDLWLLELIKRTGFLGTSNGYLQDYEWWEDVAKAVAGIELEFIEPQFAKMGAWLKENPHRTPTAKGMRRFIRTWLEKAKEQRRFNVVKK